MSDSDEDVKSGEGSETEGNAPVPIIWRHALEDKVGPIVKHLKSFEEEEELFAAVKELNPANGQALLMWATLHDRFVLVEWLINKCKREAFAFQNAQYMEIYDKWVEKRQEREEELKQRAEELAERGPTEEEEEEEGEPEPEMWQLVKEALDDVEDKLVQQIGELGVYEGGRDSNQNKHGLGKAIFANGDMYVGEYNRNKRDGIGCYFFAQAGHIYIGHWKDNQRWGLGRMIYKDNGRYYGNWERDKIHGKGRYTYQNGDTYDGEWADGRKEGQGTYTHAADSSKYQGTWHNGDFTCGRWILCSGAVYYGNFKNFVPEGRGVFIFHNKYKQEGEYKAQQWQPSKVDNLSPDAPAKLQVQIQSQQISLRFTPEGDAQDGGGIASLVAVANFKPFQNWIAALESQSNILVKDVSVRCIDRDSFKDITGVRLKVEAFDGTKAPGEQTQLPDDNVYLQQSVAVVICVVVHEGQEYVVSVRKPNLALGQLEPSTHLPRGSEDAGGFIRGPEMQKLSHTTGIRFTRSNMTDLSELAFGNKPVHSLYTSPHSSSGNFRVWLYKQVLHGDSFNALQERLAYYANDAEFLAVQMGSLAEATKQVKDLPSVTALQLLSSLGDRVPVQTADPVRPPTPPPPEPEPLPDYTEEELAMQQAALEAERAAKKPKEEEQIGEEEEEEG
eukprot:NODE_109_length_2280_cov_102.748723_g86_i0.p1 GENE.NODE_109_length_2280_cov_102.748723_g86_i0~~NODE_109_length_2280_cov_102.748723_g86_i0.p1  ORF type:complete len:673 (-),score=150.49 NODE_109_length_2280_cov_102.748723_g86_i0:160-2178(-)